ncbi:SGNH/GDSL hydrolase family protein [Myroides injenensis]|uniref:SGNH/GDSL hydrolase family protein n=1 Tax=Myroides injenensis TaxID=1183151 RepID=UPI000288CBEB|nr:GDSL-type esterase/lipase family protein [Myroides injenensis]
MKSTNCLFFGDSITFGEYDGTFGGWVDILKRYCYDKFYDGNANEVNVFNLGIGGETTKGLLDRIEVEIKARTSKEENLIFLFYGANDLAVKNDEITVSPKQFNSNLDTAIKIAQKTSDKVFLISILPISNAIEGKLSPAGKIRTNEKVRLYNAEIKEVAKSNCVMLINLYSEFEMQKEELLSRDGVHPNALGYKWISEKLKVYIEEYL